MEGRFQWRLATALVAVGGLFATSCGPAASPARREYTVRLEQHERRSGPGGDWEETNHLVVHVTETATAGGGRRLVVEDVTGEGDGRLPSAAHALAGATVEVGPDRAVTVQGEADPLVMRVVAPLVAGPVGMWQVGEPTPVVTTKGATRLERVRDLNAKVRASHLHLEPRQSLTSYVQGPTSYNATPEYRALFAGPDSVARPTRTETYLVDRNPGAGDVITCIFTFGLACKGLTDPAPVRRTRTVAVDGPATIHTTLAGPVDVDLTSTIHGTPANPLVLRGSATGHQELRGQLTAADGIPAELAGRAVAVTVDWTATAELTSGWPQPDASSPVPVPLPVLVFLAIVVAAVAVGSFAPFGSGRRAA